MMMDQNISRPRRLAFSLIELLSVVATISVLAGILIAVVGKVRAQANSAACVSNLRSFYVPFNMYAQDAKRWPSVNLNSEWSISGSGRQLWFVALMRLGYIDTYEQVIDGSDCLNSGILACPSNDVLVTRPFLMTSSPYPVLPDYAMNTYWGEMNVQPSRISTADISNPQAILLLDSETNGSRSIYPMSLGYVRWNSADCKIPTDLHSGGAHVLRADGSVGSISPETHPDIEDRKYWDPRL